MIEGTARAKTLRGLRTPARQSGEERGFEVGDSVEFYRPPAAKDLPGWHGPARVTDTTDIVRGNIGIKWQGRAMICRVQDVRHELTMLIFAMSPGSHPASSAWDVVRHFVEQLLVRRAYTLGLIHTNTWHNTPDTRKYLHVYHAARHHATTALHLDDVTTVRLGRGVTRLSALFGFQYFVLIWWLPSSPYNLARLGASTALPKSPSRASMRSPSILTKTFAGLMSL